MTRFLRFFAAFAAPLLAILVLGAPSSASALQASAVPVAVHGGVQDFSFMSYSADYHLARHVASLCRHERRAVLGHNRIGFSQPFGSVTARVHVDPAVVAAGEAAEGAEAGPRVFYRVGR